MDDGEQFTAMLSILYSRFSQEDIKKNGSLEEDIIRFIESLNNDEFYIPKELVGKNKEGLTNLGLDVGLEYYSCPLDLLISKIRVAIRSIRREKINFWTELLHKYREDKEAFDYEFKMSKERSAEMERRASKLTPDDFKDLI
jgi:hypothetical protein